MVKSDNSKGFQRYLFAVSLIVLFLGTMAVTADAFVVCPDSHEFSCSVTETCSGGSVDIFNECVDLCFVDDSATLSSGSFYFSLTFLNSKTLLGTDANFPPGGCLVNFKGTSMMIEYMPLMGATGCKYNFHCTPCDGCCTP